MNLVIVASAPGDCFLDIPGARVVAARAYLDGAFNGCDGGGDVSGVCPVLNLCPPYRYQSLGYYVSLLAEARGQAPLPRAATIEDLQSPELVARLAEPLDELIERTLAPLDARRFEFGVYFGHSVEGPYDLLAQRLFSLLPAPLLRARFAHQHGKWRLDRVAPLAAGDLPSSHLAFVRHTAAAHYSNANAYPPPRFALAILHDPDNAEPPSNPQALQKFTAAAQSRGLQPELITAADFDRIGEFDALFIRDTTFADHYTYAFSRRAAAEGLVVIDDPASILKCNNKVFLAELLARHALPAPRTLLVHRGNVGQIVPTLELPCVLKQPDSSFSIGVEKVDTAGELRAKVSALLDRSDLVVAQEWLPTEFDWRIGILDRQVLFACKYYMVEGHWQIVRHEGNGGWSEGATEAVAPEALPDELRRVALAAANLIGDGFYGVDLKQIGTRCYVMEVNDNPNVDAGNEDQLLHDALYGAVMDVFARRIEQRQPRSRPT
jgi:glutathione synthase/RimK-type ligase-like ATP-grasp enzyme